MFVRCLKAVPVAVALLLAAQSFGLEAALTYRKHSEAKGFQPYGSSSVLRPTLEAPSGEWKFPKWKSERPLFAWLELGDQKRLFVLDRKNAEDKSYNRIHFDSNGDRDLTDDPAVDASPSRYPLSTNPNAIYPVNYPPCDTTVERDGKTTPYQFTVTTYDFSRLRQMPAKPTDRDLSGMIQISVRTNCSYAGNFQWEGRNYHFVLSDANGDGCFGGKSEKARIVSSSDRTIYYNGDHLYLTTASAATYYDRAFLGDLLVIEDKPFEVRVDAAAEKMTLKPIKRGLAPMKLAGKGVQRLSLCAKDGQSCVTLHRPSETIFLPPGEYKVLSYQVNKADKSGGNWMLEAKGSSEAPFVAVAKGRDAVLKFGEPYTPFIDVQDHYRQQVKSGRATQVSLNFVIEGAGKERVTNLTKTTNVQRASTGGFLSRIFGKPEKADDPSGVVVSSKNPSRPKEPTYEVTTAEGERATSGSFEYG